MAVDNLNPYPNDPQLADLGALWDRGVKISLNCHAIGVIKSFNPTTQTAVAQITYQRTVFSLGPDGQTYIPVQVSYPPVSGIVGFLGGGGANLQFPVAAGDECLIEFNDRDFSNWWMSGGTGVPINTGRLHALSDAVIWVGVRSLPKVIKNFDGSRVVLAGADSPTGALVGVSPTQASLEMGGPSGTKIAAASKATIQVGAVTLGAEMQQLMTQLQTLVTDLGAFSAACSGSTTDPVLKAAALTLTPLLTAVGSALSTVATALGNILT